MTTTQSAKTTIFYTPYNGNLLPIYNGSTMVMTTFTELSVATTDTTKSPAAIGASKVNDWFVWSDSGTIRLGHGPDWTSDTARSAGTALTMVNGIYLNNASITNGPAASRGTYVGTTRSNASSQLDWIYGAIAATGTAAFLGVWNCYNRVLVSTLVGDSTDSWVYATTSYRPSNNSTAMRVSFVFGLAEDGYQVRFYCHCSGANGGAIGIGVNTTTATTGGTQSQANVATFSSLNCELAGLPTLGFNYCQALELLSTAGSVIFYGDAGDGSHQNGLIFAGML